ncbi:MAG: hypothetical protein V7K47_06160 [Nostoc sp.]
MINQLFKLIIKLLIAIVGVQIFLLELKLLQALISPWLVLWLISPDRVAFTTILPIVGAVEIALVWLLVLFNDISVRRGIIISLVLLIFGGINFLIIYYLTFNIHLTPK